VVAPLQAKTLQVELDRRRDHAVEGQDALGSRRRAKQTFARAARWSAPSHQAARWACGSDRPCSFLRAASQFVGPSTRPVLLAGIR
jgi:hypothetical protein